MNTSLGAEVERALDSRAGRWNLPRTRRPSMLIRIFFAKRLSWSVRRRIDRATSRKRGRRVLPRCCVHRFIRRMSNSDVAPSAFPRGAQRRVAGRTCSIDRPPPRAWITRHAVARGPAPARSIAVVHARRCSAVLPHHQAPPRA